MNGDDQPSSSEHPGAWPWRCSARRGRRSWRRSGRSGRPLPKSLRVIVLSWWAWNKFKQLHNAGSTGVKFVINTVQQTAHWSVGNALDRLPTRPAQEIKFTLAGALFPDVQVYPFNNFLGSTVSLFGTIAAFVPELALGTFRRPRLAVERSALDS